MITGENILYGDAGNDRIAGGSGNAAMHGGGGDDTFTFSGSWGKDTVEQHSNGSVTLRFSDIS